MQGQDKKPEQFQQAIEECKCYSCRLLKKGQNDNRNVPAYNYQSNKNISSYQRELQYNQYVNQQKENKNKQMNQQNDIIDKEVNIIDWITQFPRLIDIKLKRKVKFEVMEDTIYNYSTHDNSIPEISFHFNTDGSQAILFNVFSDLSILHKVINMRDSFLELLYDNDTLHAMVLIGNKLDLNNFDQNLQKFESNKLPLSTFISLKFEEQKRIFNKLGLVKKKQLLFYSGIQNLRLRNDLIEMFQSLNADFEFKDSFASDHCFIYYTQSDNLYQLEALIIGPQDTPYQGIPYTLKVIIPEEYPNVPPMITFNQQILHPNISDEGKFCLDILKNKWSSALTLQKVLISIVSLLYEKNLDDVYNYYAKRLYIDDPEQLKKLIRQQAIQSDCQNLEINYKQLDEMTLHQQALDDDENDEFQQDQFDDYEYDGQDYEEDLDNQGDDNHEEND